MFRRRVASLLVAYLLDLVAGEPPPALHPVVWVGRALDLAEGLAGPRRRPAELAAGVLGLGGVCLGAWILAGRLGKVFKRLPAPAGIVAEALALKPAFAARMLWAEALAVAGLLEAGDLGSARRRVRSLVSRPTDDLSPALVASAAIESVAENLTDSMVAPFLAYLVGGLSGAYVYRVVNTADARWGYRGRFEFFGKAAARLDDLLNFIPARLATLALMVAGRLCGENPRAALRTWKGDRRRTASPNAGQTMAAMAGLLGVRLEKPGHYVLGAAFRPPVPADIRRAVRVGRTAGGVFVAVLAGLGLLLGLKEGV